MIIYNSRNSQYFQRKLSLEKVRKSTTVEILSTSKGMKELVYKVNLQQQKFLVLPKDTKSHNLTFIYNSRNSQYFQRRMQSCCPLHIYNSRNSQYFQRPRQKQSIINIYNSRNSQYFQGGGKSWAVRVSTTVEILSTSKGFTPHQPVISSTTVEILSTSKG